MQCWEPRLWRVFNPVTDETLGEYDADSEEEALEAYEDEMDFDISGPIAAEEIEPDEAS